MANYIKPTFTLTANKNTVTSGNKGPLSIALALNASDLLSVYNVRSEIVKVPDTSGGGVVATMLVDGSAYMGATGAAGTDGGFIYLKNIHATVNIMIGVANENLSSDDEADRLMTLQPGEFAWMPWDCSQDIYVDANGTGTSGLETWVFIRTGTA